MKKLITEECSKRITSLRFILIVFVVFIHNNFTTESINEFIMNGDLSSDFVFNQNAVSQWIQYIISIGISRCAVPIFFMFSAYLQFQKNDNYKSLIKKRAKSLLLPYFLWIFLFILGTIIIKLVMRLLVPSLLSNPDDIPFISNFSFNKFIQYFVGDYSDFSTVCGPFLPQFWYIRDLFILMLISPLLTKAIRKFPIEMILFCLFFYVCKFRPLIVDSKALLFYSLGFLWAENDFDLFAFCDKCKWKSLLPLFCGFIIINKLFPKNFIHTFSVFTSIIILLKFSKILINNEKIFKILDYLSEYSFFLFAIHTGFVLLGIRTIWLKILPMKTPFLCLAEYFGVTILVCFFGTIIGICLKKICPKVFRILCGGR